NGEHWQHSPVPDLGDFALDDVTALASDDVWAVGSSFRTKGTLDTTVILHWDGRSWTRSTSPNEDGKHTSLGAIHAIAANDIWAVGYSWVAGTHDRHPFAIHWNGRHWAKTATPNQSGELYQVAA